MNFEESMQAVRAAKQRRAAWIREQVECGHIVPCTKPGDDCGCQQAPEQSQAASEPDASIQPEVNP